MPRRLACSVRGCVGLGVGVGLALLGCGRPTGGGTGNLAAPDAAADAASDAAIDASRDALMLHGPPGVPDLQFIASEMAGTVVYTMDDFRDTDCEVVEGCVGAAGRRSLVRFDTVSANLGMADLVVGAPPPPGESNDLFEWSPCHMHHHVRNYASYELLDGDNVVLTGRKQAFCLEDGEQLVPGIAAVGYQCMNQGITRGWADVYSRYLPCQWLDVTGLPSGSYTLRVTVNPLHTLPESDYDNNTFTVGVAF